MEGQAVGVAVEVGLQPQRNAHVAVLAAAAAAAAATRAGAAHQHEQQHQEQPFGSRGNRQAAAITLPPLTLKCFVLCRSGCCAFVVWLRNGHRHIPDSGLSHVWSFVWLPLPYFVPACSVHV